MDIRSLLEATLSGTYTLDRELGGGGMSRVFVADEPRLNRKVVVKVLSPELAAGISAERQVVRQVSRTGQLSGDAKTSCLTATSAFPRSAA